MKRFVIPVVFVNVALRILSAMATSWFVYAGWVQWRLAPARWTLLLMIVGELTVVLLLLTARNPERRDWRPLSVCTTLVATYYFLTVRLSPGLALISEGQGVVLQGLGLSFALYAKWTLRRSFGLLPANRGVVTGGAYKLVRHPIYLGYFIGHMGYLFSNFCLRNLLVYGLLYLVQALRILREESLLKADPGYRRYMRQVRTRALPGVF